MILLSAMAVREPPEQHMPRNGEHLRVVMVVGWLRTWGIRCCFVLRVSLGTLHIQPRTSTVGAVESFHGRAPPAEIIVVRVDSGSLNESHQARNRHGSNSHGKQP